MNVHPMGALQHAEQSDILRCIEWRSSELKGGDMDEQPVFCHEDMHPVSSVCDRLLRLSGRVCQFF